MFRNYLVTALRNIARHKLYSFINIAGLAVGLACAILIMLFVHDELSYDKWIAGSENLWRVEVTYHVPGRADPIITAQTTMPDAGCDARPDSGGAQRRPAWSREGMTLTAGDRQFSENVGVVDPNFLQMIPLPLVEGDPRTVLSRPENLVISQSAARKYFGDADPIGKTLTTGRGGCDMTIRPAPTPPSCFKVVGVMRDLPHNTQLDFDFLMPNTSLADRHRPGTQEKRGSATTTVSAMSLWRRAPIPRRCSPSSSRSSTASIDISAFTNVKIPGSQHSGDPADAFPRRASDHRPLLAA